MELNWSRRGGISNPGVQPDRYGAIRRDNVGHRESQRHFEQVDVSSMEKDITLIDEVQKSANDQCNLEGSARDSIGNT